MFDGVSINLFSRSSNTPSSTFASTSLTSSPCLVYSRALRLGRPDLSVTPEPFNFLDVLSPLALGWLSSTSSTKDAHLLGQHTVRMSPISTAQLNHHGQSFCLAPDNFVLIPVLLNNTDVSGLRYSLAPLGYEGKESVEFVDVTAKEFNAIEQSRLETVRHSPPPSPVSGHSEEYDDYDDDTDDSERQPAHSSLQKSQSLVYIRLAKPGTLSLERVFDVANIDARLHQPSAVTVVPCPQVEFVEDDITKDNVRCAGQDSELGLMIDIHGVPPLSLRWLKTINGRREQFLVEGIEGGHERERPSRSVHGADQESSDGQDGALMRRTTLPKKLRIPLTIPLDVPGTYLYALEEVMDAVGNVVRLGSDFAVADSGSTSQTKTTRSLVVLRRLMVSFKHCGPGTPASLLIGSDVPLTISANEADSFDAPWEISLKYQPPAEVDGNKGSKRSKAWTKTLKTQGGNRELIVNANTPGEYTIVGVHGKVVHHLHFSGGLLNSWF
jgi:nucleoporin POM152